MNSLNTLKEEMRKLLPAMDSERFDAKIFAQTGMFVVRKALNKETIAKWLKEYRRQVDACGTEGRKQGYNPVEFQDLKEGLHGIWRDPQILKVISQIFGADLGVFKARFVVKDKNFRGNIFLHQDTSYQMGGVEKVSAFITLTEAGPHNGGLILRPGTFRFGFLGDAGEINPNLLPSDWPVVCPLMEAGDMLLMHSMTWHESGSYVDGPDRVLTDFIYQPASDPSTMEVVSGQGGWEANFLNSKRGDDYQNSLFVRCRTLTIKELYKKVDAFEGKTFSGTRS